MGNKNSKHSITYIIADILQSFEIMQGKVAHYVCFEVNLCVPIIAWIVK